MLFVFQSTSFQEENNYEQIEKSSPHEGAAGQVSHQYVYDHCRGTSISVDEEMLRSFMQLKVTEANINEFGRFDKLKATVDKATAKTFLESLEGAVIKPFQVNMKVDQILRKFILEGGFDF